MRFTYDADPTLRETVFQAMGFASVCWSAVENAGEFESTLATEAGTQAIDAVRHVITFELSKMFDSTCTASEWNAAIEAAIAKIETLP